MEKKYRDKLIKNELMIMDEIDRICKEDNLEYFLTAGSLLGAIRHGGIIPWDDDIDIAMPRKDFEKFINESYKKMDNIFYLDFFNTNRKYYMLFAKVRIKGTAFKEKNIDKDCNSGIWIDVFPLDDISSCDVNKAAKTKRKLKRMNLILLNKYAFNIKKYNRLKDKMIYIISNLIPNRPIINRINRLSKKNNNKKMDCFINYGSNYSVNKQIHEKSWYYPTKYIKFEDREYKAPNNIDYVLRKIYGEKYMELPPKEKRVSHNPLYIKFSDGEYVDFNA